MPGRFQNNRSISIFLLVSSLIALCSFLYYAQSPYFHAGLRQWLENQLNKCVPCPPSSSPTPDQHRLLIYVLGGTEERIQFRFLVAARLYQLFGPAEVSSLSVPGITHYDQVKRRNLTNDEWRLDTLASLGIRKDHVELVPVQQGFFGTLSEAKGVSRWAASKGYDRVILVTSSYHTMRVWITFSSFFVPRNVELCLYSSPDNASIPDLSWEYFKLITYRYCILPFVSV
jgi:uncharacterized SAM-binding protein YcdF (DUF218 family)